MWACLVLCVAAALVGAVSADCDACIYGRCYRKHRLPLSEWGYPMDIDMNKNILYVRQGEFYSATTLQQCQLDTGTCNGTGSNWDISSFTVDQRTGNTYGRILGEMSLYKMDVVNKEKKLLVHGNVYYISFRDKLYFSTNGKGIYTFEDGESRRVAGTEAYAVFNFVIDKNNDIYFGCFLQDKFVIRRLSKGVVDQTVYWDGSLRLAVDREGNVVFIDAESGAVYRLTNGEQVEVGVIDDSIIADNWLVTPLFDKDNNVIYRNSSLSYFHLKQERDIHCIVLNIPKLNNKERIIAEIVVNAEKDIDLIPIRSVDTEPANGGSL